MTATTALRLLRLHAASRRIPATAAMIVAIGVGLRLALIAHWDTYGALQLPLVAEAACAAVIAVAIGSPLGEPERVAGSSLPLLRLITTVALTAAAAAVLAAASLGATLTGGVDDLLRNLAGATGLGLLGAVILGAGMAWMAPLAYLLAGVYALYTQWHGPALTSPLLWPARPPGDLGGAAWAASAFAIGLALATIRGAHDRREE